VRKSRIVIDTHPLEASAQRGDFLRAFEDALHANHTLRREIELSAEALDFFLVAFNRDVHRHVVVRGDHLHLDLLLASGVIQVVLTRERREQRETVPCVTARKGDGAHETDAKQTDEDAERDVRRRASFRRDVTLKSNHLARVGDDVVVPTEKRANFPRHIILRRRALNLWSRDLKRLSHDFTLRASLDERVQPRRAQDEQKERRVVRVCRSLGQPAIRERPQRHGAHGARRRRPHHRLHSVFFDNFKRSSRRRRRLRPRRRHERVFRRRLGHARGCAAKSSRRRRVSLPSRRRRARRGGRRRRTRHQHHRRARRRPRSFVRARVVVCHADGSRAR